MKLVLDDGGRARAGFKGTAGDCVVRSIAIATRKPYAEVYLELGVLMVTFATTSRSRQAKLALAKGRTTPRTGVQKQVYRNYLKSLGWEWVPLMQIGIGCKTHLRAEELPRGRIIVRLSRHLAAVVDGVLHDTHDCSRGGRRCVYGYYRKRRRKPRA